MSWDAGLNPWQGFQWVGQITVLVAYRSFEKAMAYAEWNRYTWVALIDNRGSNKEAEESRHAGMNILHEARRPIRELCSKKGPRGHNIHQGHQECTTDRGISITWKFSGGSPLEAGRRSHRADILTSRSPPSSNSEAKVAQSCPTLCDPMDCIVHGSLLARILESVAFPFARGSSQTSDQTHVCHTAGRFFTNWATREAQKYWSE